MTRGRLTTTTTTATPATPRKRAPKLGPAEYALLGLIAVATRDDAASGGGGVHGYDLSRRLQTGSLAEIIRLEPGMLYHYLKKLDRAGLVVTSVEHQVSRPDRQDHTLTEEGDAMLQAWLDAPVQATRDVRLDFLVKLWFVRELDPVRAVALVREQRAVIKRLLGSLQEQRAETTADGDADAAGPDAAHVAAQAAILRDTLDLRIAQTQAVLSWLNTLPENGQIVS
ncbi:MAG: PadR family transcriptional regulator [Thermomicrobiales bacterium]